ncbi:MAG: hypothetical protein QXY24_02850 [Candidatus Aenigmatarchaeota archaeon]
MRFYLSLIFVSLLVLSSPVFAADFTVGVSPPVINLGEVERGSTKIVKFYLVTPSTDPLLVYLEAENGNLDFFSSDRYRDLIFNYSEESTQAWAEFLSNPIELKPANETLKTRGGEIRGWREVSFLLNVPKNAEPGYHLVKIKPSPSLPSEAIGQAGARVVAITSVAILFNVPGEAKREGIILDVVAGKYVGNRLEINTYFQNTGSVTISARALQEIVKDGVSIENLTSSTQFLKPGETKIFKTYLPSNKISYGNYTVLTTVSYTTGSTSRNSTLVVEALPIIEKPEEIFPWWIVAVILILLIAIGIYKWYK